MWFSFLKLKGDQSQVVTAKEEEEKQANIDTIIFYHILTWASVHFIVFKTLHYFIPQTAAHMLKKADKKNSRQHWKN
jgi:hypothetical protein